MKNERSILFFRSLDILLLTVQFSAKSYKKQQSYQTGFAHVKVQKHFEEHFKTEGKGLLRLKG